MSTLVARLGPFVAALMLVGGVLSGLHLVRRLRTDRVYTDDFLQDYASARAVLSRESPYRLSGSALSVKYVPAAAPYMLGAPYATPHTPLMALVVVPLALVPYDTARALWLALELCLLVGVVRLAAPESSRRASVVLATMLLAWTPVEQELRFGQWSLLLAVLAALAWRADRAGQAGRAGTFLGVAIALKLFPALLLGVFLAQRSWRTAGRAVLVATVGTAAPALVDRHLVTDYLRVALHAPREVFASLGNYSALSAAARLVTPTRDFAGTVPAIVPATWAVVPLCAMVGMVLAGATVWIVRTCRRDGDFVFATGLCAVTALSPLVWQHYLCLLVWPLWRLGRRLELADWPRQESRSFFAALALLSVPNQAVALAALRTSAAWPPAGAGVLLALPMGPLILLGLLPRFVAEGHRLGS